MLLVINEWVFHDLLLENGESKFLETARFLIAFQRTQDWLVIPSEPRWNDKAYRLMMQSDPKQRQISKLLHGLLRDSGRAVRVRAGERPPISEDLFGCIPEKDVYLIDAYISTSADLLVTTDIKLFDVLGESDLVNCQRRSDFLSEYSYRGASDPSSASL